jgi:hypothetical protein
MLLEKVHKSRNGSFQGAVLSIPTEFLWSNGTCFTPTFIKDPEFRGHRGRGHRVCKNEFSLLSALIVSNSYSLNVSCMLSVIHEAVKHFP